jgi:signal transduction histidine kinase
MQGVRSSSLRVALESAWSTSPVIWTIGLPFQVLGTLLRNGPLYPGRIGVLILVVLAGQFIVLAMLLLARSLRRPGRPLESMTAAQVVLLWAACGVVLTVTVHASIGIFVDATDSPGIGLESRLLYVTAALVLSYLGLTYLADGVVRTQLDVYRLRKASERVESLKRESEGAVETQARLLMETLNAQVIPDLEHLADEAEGLAAVALTHDLESLQSRVAYYSEIIVRTLSRDVLMALPSRTHDIADDTAPAGLSARALGRMVLHSPVRLVPSGILFSLLAFLQVVPSCLGRVGLMSMCAVGVVALGNLVAWWWSSSLRQRALERFGNHVAIEYLGAIGIAMQYLLLIAAIVWARQTPLVACEWRGGLPEFVIVIVIGLAAIMSLSTALEMSRRSAASAIILESRIQESEAIAADLDRMAERMRDQVAVMLHGSVQGRLTAISLALRSYVEEVRRGQSPDHRQLIRRVTELLDLALSDVHAIFGENDDVVSIETRLHALQGEWAGLIEVTWGMSPRAAELLGADPDLDEWAQEMVDEAVTNASRHGQARSVRIRLDGDHETGTRLVISAVDDGFGPTAGLRPGLAAERVLARGGSWSLEPGPGGSGAIMTVVLPAGRG